MLITDDNQFNQLALMTLLQQFNLSGDVASDGFEARQLVARRLASGAPMYGLIMMDFSMPGMDGTTCTKKIRELLNGRGLRPRICCVTAYSDREYKDMAFGVGMDEFMTKPVFKN